MEYNAYYGQLPICAKDFSNSFSLGNSIESINSIFRNLT